MPMRKSIIFWTVDDFRLLKKQGQKRSKKMKKKICKKLQNSMVLSERCDRILAALVCLLVLASAATAETLDDCRDQTIVGQNFTFTFSPVELSDGTDGTLTIHARGDYSVSFPTIEYLTWNIDGLCSGTAAPAYGTVIHQYSHDDVEWEQIFTISGACLTAATSDASVTISLDLSSSVHIYGPSFVCVELVYGYDCLPPAEPNNPDPCDGDVNVPVDTWLSWNGGPDGGFEVIEDFEDGDISEYTIFSGASHVVSTAAAHDGVYGLEDSIQGASEWIYRNDTTVQVSQGQTVSYWIKGLSLGRIYCGFGASSAGTYSLVAADNSNQLIIQLNEGFWYRDIGAVSQNWVPNKWYRMEVQWDVGGLITGRLYDSDGVTLLNTVTATDGTYTQGGIAMRGFMHFYLDTVERSGPSALATQWPLEAVAFGPVVVEPRNPAEATGWDEENEAFIFEESQPVVPMVNTIGEPTSTKEEAAPEVTFGGPVAMSTGGPDCGGYTYIDSSEPGGPSFDWIDIRITGTNLGLTDDSYAFPITLPFGFDFYGSSYNQVAVGSNGAIYFQQRYMTLANVCIPGVNGSGIDQFIALYWDDLYPSGSNNVYYKIVGSAPNRILVVQWQNVGHYGSTYDRVTAQAHLFENNGDILLLYSNPSSEAGAGATVGIQRDPSCGLEYLCNQANLHSGLAVLFTRGTPPCAGTTYDVYFGTDPCAMELLTDCNGICEPNCDPTPGPGETLEECTTYYWQVIAENRCNDVNQGDIWSFTTEGVCNRDPNCRDAIPSITEIWPPNHKWVDVEILDVIDPDPCDIVSITITGITQDEPVAGGGSGSTLPDADGIGMSMARLRAERSGLGDGRVYEISFEATDNRGGVCDGAVQVCVPHSMGRTAGDTTPGRVCIDGGQSYDSTGLELLSVDLNNDGIINVLDFAKLADYWLVSYEVEQ